MNNIQQTASVYVGFDSLGQIETEAVQQLKQIDTSLQLAVTSIQKQAVIDFVSHFYRQNYPAIKPDINDRHFKNSLVLFAEDRQGNIIASFNLAFDDGSGFPEEGLFKKHLKAYRAAGKAIIQMVRWVIPPNGDKENLGLALECLKTLYLLPRKLGVDLVLGMPKQKEVSFHRRLGAEIFEQELTVSDCPQYLFCTLVWPLDKMTDRFFDKVKCQPIDKLKHHSYPPQQWDDYARAFASVQTSFQRELQLAAAEHLHGDIVDCGCGSAKLAPFLADKSTVKGYVGIDYTPQMVKMGRWIIEQFSRPSFEIWQGKIEQYQGQVFDSAVSINSYYSWPEPELVLKHIYTLLKPGGVFVLATPNPALNMKALEKEARKELFAHPDWALFCQINHQLAANSGAKFLQMSKLIRQLDKIGFAVQSCHQQFYLGGMNFLQLIKPV